MTDLIDEPAGLYSTGLSLYRQGRYERALDVLEAARRDSPENWHIAYRVSKTLIALDRHDEALAALDHAMTLHGSKKSLGIAAKGVAACLRAADDGQFGDAVALLEQAVRLDPENGTLRVWLGDALLGAGRTDQAIHSYTTATHINSENENLHWRFFKLATALESLGREIEAADAHREAVVHGWTG